MNNFALYRLPFADECTLVVQETGEPEELVSCADLDGRKGYVFAPFAPSPSEPVLLLRPDRVERCCVDVLLSSGSIKELSGVEQNGIKSADVDSGVTFEENMQHSLTHCMPDAQDKEKYGMDAVYPDSRMRALYHTDFDKFHTQLENGSFRKIVLSRCAVESSNAAVDMFRLFVDACSRYPRMFISLVSTSRAGVWLTASPEILLERHCSCDSRAGAPYTFRTIALAGTMPWADDVRWSEKNIREQRYVATYIKKALENASDKIDEEGPYTTRAANLAHLRSDFTFTLQQTGKLGSLLHTLHPTPAVCGLPKDETYKFILNEESSPRHYYSGFQGPLSTDADTHLYVSLRCMNILSGHCLLYAGGGLMKDSDEESEWLETEAKMNTMRDIL